MMTRSYLKFSVLTLKRHGCWPIMSVSPFNICSKGHFVTHDLLTGLSALGGSLARSRGRLKLLICLYATLATAAGCRTEVKPPPESKDQYSTSGVQSEGNQKLAFRCGIDDPDLFRNEIEQVDPPKIGSYHSEFESPISSYSYTNRKVVEKYYTDYNKFRDQVVENVRLRKFDKIENDMTKAINLYKYMYRFDNVDSKHAREVKSDKFYIVSELDLSVLYYNVVIRNAFLLYSSDKVNLSRKIKVLRILREQINLSDPFLRMNVLTSLDPVYSQAIAFALFLNGKYDFAYRVRYGLMSGLINGPSARYSFRSVAPLPETVFDAAKNDGLDFSNWNKYESKYSDVNSFSGETCNLKTVIDASWIILANEAAKANSDRMLITGVKARAQKMLSQIKYLERLSVFKVLDIIANQNL